MSKSTRSHGSKRFTSRRTRSSKAKLDASMADEQNLFGEESSSSDLTMHPETQTEKKTKAKDNVSKKKKGVPQKRTETATREATESDNDDRPIKEYLAPAVDAKVAATASEVDKDMKPSAAKIPKLDNPEEKSDDIKKEESKKTPEMAITKTEKDEKKESSATDGGDTSKMDVKDDNEEEKTAADENVLTEVAKKDNDKEETDAISKNIPSEETKVKDGEKEEKSTTEETGSADESKKDEDAEKGPASAEIVGNDNDTPSAASDAVKQDDTKEIQPSDSRNKIGDDAAATLAAIDSAIEALVARASAAARAAQNQDAGEGSSADAAKECSDSPLSPSVSVGIPTENNIIKWDRTRVLIDECLDKYKDVLDTNVNLAPTMGLCKRIPVLIQELRYNTQ